MTRKHLQPAPIVDAASVAPPVDGPTDALRFPLTSSQNESTPRERLILSPSRAERYRLSATSSLHQGFSEVKTRRQKKARGEAADEQPLLNMRPMIEFAVNILFTKDIAGLFDEA